MAESSTSSEHVDAMSATAGFYMISPLYASRLNGLASIGMAESSTSSEHVDAMSATAGVMEKLDSHLKLAKKCMEEVQELSSREFNDGQCDYLIHKLDMAIQSASLFLEKSQVQFNGLHRLMPSARQVQIFELLVALAKQGESFVRSCCQDTWMHSAVTLANAAAYISWLGFNLELCKIALNYGQASLKSLTIDEVSKIHEDEVEVVEKRASRDANILLKKVTVELNTPDSSENRKLAKYLDYLLVGDDPKPGFDNVNNPFWGFFDWVVPRKKDRKIGSSATATVYKEEWLGIRVAKKTFYGPKNEDFLKEVEILSQLRHPSITSMFCCHTNKLSCSIIMELMSGDLCHMIRRRRERNGDAPPFTVMEGIDLMLQVGEGVKYLHEKRIVHRDLKSSNILVKNVEVSGLELGYVQAKVADFGISKTKEHSMSYSTTSFNIGTCRWMAPEVINTYQENQVGFRAVVESPKYVFKVDIYSFAMVCFEVLSGEVPFQSEGKLSKVKEKVLKGERPIIPGYCPFILKSLIEKCWSQNPSERLHIGDVCKQLKYIKYLWMTRSYQDAPPGSYQDAPPGSYQYAPSGSYQDDDTWPSPRTLVTAVIRMKTAVTSFAKVLDTDMKNHPTEMEKFKQAIRDEVRAEVERLNDWKFLVRAFLCRRLFHDFDASNGYYGLEDYAQDRMSTMISFAEFTKFKDLSATISKLMKPPSPDKLDTDRSKFLERFCFKKFKFVFNVDTQSLYEDELFAVESGRHPNTSFYQSFLNLAVSVWLLHRLVHSFDDKVKMLTYEPGHRFERQYMESVVPGVIDVDEENDENINVIFTVIPGFQVSQSVIKSCVYIPDGIPSQLATTHIKPGPSIDKSPVKTPTSSNKTPYKPASSTDNSPATVKSSSNKTLQMHFNDDQPGRLQTSGGVTSISSHESQAHSRSGNVAAERVADADDYWRTSQARSSRSSSGRHAPPASITSVYTLAAPAPAASGLYDSNGAARHTFLSKSRMLANANAAIPAPAPAASGLYDPNAAARHTILSKSRMLSNAKGK